LVLHEGSLDSSNKGDFNISYQSVTMQTSAIW
jgi:hypothetical protein